MRIEIQYPEKTVLSCQTRVRITDLSASGHVGFDSLVALIPEGILESASEQAIL